MHCCISGMTSDYQPKQNRKPSSYLRNQKAMSVARCDWPIRCQQPGLLSELFCRILKPIGSFQAAESLEKFSVDPVNAIPHIDVDSPIRILCPLLGNFAFCE